MTDKLRSCSRNRTAAGPRLRDQRHCEPLTPGIGLSGRLAPAPRLDYSMTARIVEQSELQGAERREMSYLTWTIIIVALLAFFLIGQYAGSLVSS